MLKKQTVWLLTMLSLMIVLSVYYIMSPSGDDLAFVNTGSSDSQETSGKDTSEDEDIDVDMANVGRDELFTTIRMEMQDERNMAIERLEDIVASSSASVEEKDKALKDIDRLEDISAKETILEEMILSNNEYKDVLVRSEDDKVQVHVISPELSPTEVVNIMQVVRDEFGDIPVIVDVQPADEE